MTSRVVSDDEIAAPAATVILLRDKPAFEVLMIARHEGSAFARGALVFPGGRVDPGDLDARWNTHAAGMSADGVIAAAQIASVREAFEEAGVLLATARDGTPLSGARVSSFNSWRQDVEKDDNRFLDLIAGEDLIVRCDWLQLFAHWVAPPGLHRRFDTLFFVSRFPEGQAVLEDGNEATEALWINPGAALAARQDGKRKIIFPTACNLALLDASACVTDVFESTARRTIRPVTPALTIRDGVKTLSIPGDLGYPLTEEPLDFARPD